jgi:hypothetical protein
MSLKDFKHPSESLSGWFKTEEAEYPCAASFLMRFRLRFGSPDSDDVIQFVGKALRFFRDGHRREMEEEAFGGFGIRFVVERWLEQMEFIDYDYPGTLTVRGRIVMGEIDEYNEMPK